MTGHKAAINSVQFRDHLVVSASGDRLVKVWDVRIQKEVLSFSGHTRGIACVAFDGRSIVSGSSGAFYFLGSPSSPLPDG